MSKAYLLLGSNQGDRAAILADAVGRIGAVCGRTTALSPLYESEPWGFEADTWFLNQAVELSTDINPHRLLHMLLHVEHDLGRRRDDTPKGYASRPIDIDMLYYDDLVADTRDLVVPHPRLHLRRFVLLPLCDIAPDLPHPILRLTQRQLLEKCFDTLKVRRLS